MIRFENVSFGYKEEISIIRDVSFHVEKGSITAVIGANGAGKSTMARLMRGLARPDKGQILLDGVDFKTMKASAMAAQIGYLFQNPDRQICKNTVKEELEFSLEHTVQDPERKEALIQEVLTALDLDPEAEPFLLSRGERQRVALASALVHKPELLILDEPTTGLDYKECTQIMEYVAGLNQEGMTVVMVCHDMEVVLDYSTRVIVMTDGHVIAEGQTKAIFQDQDTLSKAALLPPQIIGLSQMMGEGFEGISTVAEMADAIEEKAKGGAEK